MSQLYLAEPRAFTTQNAARMLNMSPEVLRYRIRRGQVRAARIGRRHFVPAIEIDRLTATTNEVRHGAAS